jgi:hypothetical protein
MQAHVTLFAQGYAVEKFKQHTDPPKTPFPEIAAMVDIQRQFVIICTSAAIVRIPAQAPASNLLPSLTLQILAILLAGWCHQSHHATPQPPNRNIPQMMRKATKRTSRTMSPNPGDDGLADV